MLRVWSQRIAAKYDGLDLLAVTEESSCFIFSIYALKAKLTKLITNKTKWKWEMKNDYCYDNTFWSKFWHALKLKRKLQKQVSLICWNINIYIWARLSISRRV